MAELRLYSITDTTTGLEIPDLFFALKKLAVYKRQELNGTDLSAPPPQTLRYVVTPGPDNDRYKKK